MNKVLAIIVLWNKVSLTSSYLNDARSGVSEGPIKIWRVGFIVSFQIFAFDVLVRAINWLAFNAIISLFCLLYIARSDIFKTLL